MHDCTGSELFTELCFHLGFEKSLKKLLPSTSCISCVLPYITSQFFPRKSGDRPAVIPNNSTNLALIGQYCDIPEDIVFTMEYSIRSAQKAVFGLLGLGKEPTPIYHGQHHPKVLYEAIKTFLR
jgi:oleate hydratase